MECDGRIQEGGESCSRHRAGKVEHTSEVWEWWRRSASGLTSSEMWARHWCAFVCLACCRRSKFIGLTLFCSISFFLSFSILLFSVLSFLLPFSYSIPFLLTLYLFSFPFSSFLYLSFSYPFLFHFIPLFLYFFLSFPFSFFYISLSFLFILFLFPFPSFPSETPLWILFLSFFFFPFLSHFSISIIFPFPSFSSFLRLLFGYYPWPWFPSCITRCPRFRRGAAGSQWRRRGAGGGGVMETGHRSKLRRQLRLSPSHLLATPPEAGSERTATERSLNDGEGISSPPHKKNHGLVGGMWVHGEALRTIYTSRETLARLIFFFFFFFSLVLFHSSSSLHVFVHTHTHTAVKMGGRRPLTHVFYH